VPFRGFAWQSAWWRHYGGPRELCVLAVFDDERLAGVAPWYFETLPGGGRVLRPLGTGEVCSDYLSILCRPEQEAALAAALAEFLSGRDAPEWDAIHLDAVDGDDTAVARLAEELTARGAAARRRETHRCWRVALPGSWEEFLMMQSKSHRKQLRRTERASPLGGRARLHECDDATFARGWEILVDLHQRRRQSLGQPGCFASPAFAAFHRAAAEQLLAQGQLRLSWLELDGRPAAAEYQVAGDDATYAYQSGVDPERLGDDAGRLMMMATIRRAIETGQRSFDFLRGDEPYKAHWRAAPRPAFDWRIAANTPRAKLRHGAWLATDNLKGWLKGAKALVSGSGS
jgi:CelD/BcsL family acetyltransferase involved in cellulose biosynthesis